MDGLDSFIEEQRLKHYPTPESALNAEVHTLKLVIKKAIRKQICVKPKITENCIKIFNENGLKLTLMDEKNGWFTYLLTFTYNRDKSPSRERNTPES